jgi:hypothetical protein
MLDWLFLPFSSVESHHSASAFTNISRLWLSCTNSTRLHGATKNNSTVAFSVNDKP